MNKFNALLVFAITLGMAILIWMKIAETTRRKRIRAAFRANGASRSVATQTPGTAPDPAPLAALNPYAILG